MRFSMGIFRALFRFFPSSSDLVSFFQRLIPQTSLVFFCLFIRCLLWQSRRLCVCNSYFSQVYPSLCITVCPCLSVYLSASISLNPCLCLCLSVCLSLARSLSLPPPLSLSLPYPSTITLVISRLAL